MSHAGRHSSPGKRPNRAKHIDWCCRGSSAPDLMLDQVRWIPGCHRVSSIGIRMTVKRHPELPPHIASTVNVTEAVPIGNLFLTLRLGWNADSDRGQQGPGRASRERARPQANMALTPASK